MPSEHNGTGLWATLTAEQRAAVQAGQAEGDIMPPRQEATPAARLAAIEAEIAAVAAAHDARTAPLRAEIEAIRKIVGAPITHKTTN